MVSIAICTYNRASLLNSAFASLTECNVPEAQWELLIIDNNSSDQTKAVAESFKDRLPLRYIFEPEQGLSAARNRALRECSGDWLLFTDDDVRLDPNWLAAYTDAVVAYPEVGYLGGRVVPYWSESKPRWLQDESLALISGLLVRYHLGEQTRPYTEGESTPFGASFGLSRKAFESVGKFRLDLGVNGGVPGRGEEAEYLDRVRRAGWSGVYVGEAVAYHWTDSKRLTLPYLYRYGVQKGIAGRRMHPDAGRGSRRKALLYALKGIGQLLKGRGDRARQCVINVGIQEGLRFDASR